jgi:hypothetical protein
MYYIDIVGIKGKLRKWLGWTIIICSDIAFAAATIFSMKRLFVSEYYQTPLVNWTMLAMDFGLGIILVLVGGILIWRLKDLFSANGLWAKESASPELELERTAVLTQEGRDAIKKEMEI